MSDVCICTGNESFVVAQTLGPALTVLNAVSQIANTVNVSSNNANSALATVANVVVALDAVNTNIDIVYSAANDAFTLADQANTTANLAYDQANTDHVLITSIFDTVLDEVIPSVTVANDAANNALEVAEAAYAVANTANSINVTPAFDKANAAFDLAVAGNTYAQSVSVIAATGVNNANLSYGQANLAYTAANAANGLAQSAVVLAVAGNTWAQTAFTTAIGQANVALAVGLEAYAEANTAADAAADANLLATIANTKASLAYAQANAATSTAGDALTLAVAANVYAQTVATVATQADNQANGAFVTANLAYDAANSGIANAAIANTNAVGAGLAAANAMTYAVSVNAFATQVNTLATIANTTANLAYGQANIAISTANSAVANAAIANNLANLSYTAANAALILAADSVANSNAALILATDANTIAFTAIEIAGFANGIAQDALTLAGQANTLAETAYVIANGAYVLANVTLPITLAAYAEANTANLVSNLAYTAANVGIFNANLAYIQANVAIIAANSAIANAAIANTNALAAYTAANSAIANAAIANGIAVAANTTANLAFAAANSGIANAAIANTNALAAYTAANAAANTVSTYANGTLVLAGGNLNFNNTGAVALSVTANGTSQANIAVVLRGRGLDARDFGVDPTGVADSTAALQSAINAASNAKTFLYTSGTYKISNTINNLSAPNWMGFQSEAFANTIINCPSLPANSNAFNIVNAAVGFAMVGGLQVVGPGTSSNLCSGIVFLSPGSGIADQIHLADIEIKNFAANSLFLNNPIVSTFERIRIQGFGQNGFIIEPHPSNANDGGTSTTWINCYANGGGANSDSGYNFNGHQYFSMHGCASDHCANSYFFSHCNGFTLTSCGNESNIQTLNSNGVSVTLNSCTGFVVTAHRTYDLNTNSIMFNVLGGGFGSILNPVYTQNLNTPNTEIVLDGNSRNVTVISPYSSNKTNQYAAVQDNGANNFVAFGSQVQSQVTYNPTSTGADPLIGFANSASGQVEYIIRRWSTIGPNGSLVIGTSGGTELFVVQDGLNNNQPSFIQAIDPINQANGRLALGDTGAWLDYNTLNAGQMTLSKPTTIQGAANVTGSLTVSQNSTTGNLVVNSQAVIPSANITNIQPGVSGLLQITANGINAGLNISNPTSAQTWYVTVNGTSGSLVFFNPITSQTVLSLSNTNQLAQFGGIVNVASTINAPFLNISANASIGNLAITAQLTTTGNVGIGTNTPDAALRVLGQNLTGLRIGLNGSINDYDAPNHNFRDMNGGNTALAMNTVSQNVTYTSNIIMTTGYSIVAKNVSATLANITTANITTLAPTKIQEPSGTSETILTLAPILGSNSNSSITLGANGSTLTYTLQARYTDDSLHFLHSGSTIAVLGNTGGMAFQANCSIQAAANSDANVLITGGGSAGGGNTNATVRLVNSSNGSGFAYEMQSRGTDQKLWFRYAGNDKFSIDANGSIQSNGSSSNLANFGVYQNGTAVIRGVANVNFVNSPTVNVSVTANGTNQSNISFTANVTGGGGGTVLAVTSGNTSNLVISGNASNVVIDTGPVLGGVEAALASVNATAFLYSNVGSIAANTVVNLSTGAYQDVTLTASTNAVFQNAASIGRGTSFTLLVRQTTGSMTLGYANTIRWSDNLVPTLSTTANTMDVLQFMTIDGGTIWFGSQVMANIPLANVY